MRGKEFYKFCSKTEIGTPLAMTLEGRQANGTFLGCAPDGVVVESGGQVSVWPLDLIEVRKRNYPTPSYS